MLNEEQKKAVSIIEGPVLVIAGAGTGKTKTISERVLNLIKNGVNPKNILAITFTNKAAKEMKERIILNLEKEKSLLNLSLNYYEIPLISTFHSLGVKIIRDNHTKFNIPKNFKILDKEDSRKIIKESIKLIGFNPKDFDLGKIMSIISKQKSNLNMPKLSEENISEISFKIWKKYEEIKSEEKVLDFDDLILKPTLLLEKEKEILKHYQDIWKYIHIDEYQDTNKAQYRITKLLSGSKQNIYAVGDIDQNIYSWRNADIKNLLNFEKDFKNTKTVILKENYRSTKTILKVANEIISKNVERIEKELITNNPEGDKISIYNALNETMEAYFVAERVRDLINKKINPNKIAILFRTNFQSRVMEEAFLSLNIPYEIFGTRFFERKEVKDLISFIRLSTNPESNYDLKRIINVPPRGIGKVTILKIMSKKEEELNKKAKERVLEFKNLIKKISEALEEKKLSEALRYMVKETGIEKIYEEEEEKIENIKELVSFAQKYDKLPKKEALENFLTESALLGDKEEGLDKKNGTKIMTVHSAKGLEFDYVFITGLEEGLFPHINSEENRDVSKKEEERRLFYVAITRAKKKVFLTYADERNIYGSREVNMPSEFLCEIDDRFIEKDFWIEPSDPRMFNKNSKYYNEDEEKYINHET